MKRMLFLAAGLCLATAAHAQGVKQKYDWNDTSNQTCMEPYAPAVPKAEETSLKEMLEKVKPEVQAFIDESNRYLDCLTIQLNRAKEDRDQEKIKKLIKAHNDNVQYQQTVATEFNTALETLKKQAGQAVGEAGAADAGGDGSKPKSEGEGGAETADAAGSGANDGGEGEAKPEG